MDFKSIIFLEEFKGLFFFLNQYELVKEKASTIFCKVINTYGAIKVYKVIENY